MLGEQKSRGPFLSMCIPCVIIIIIQVRCSELQALSHKIIINGKVAVGLCGNGSQDRSKIRFHPLVAVGRLALEFLNCSLFI